MSKWDRTHPPDYVPAAQQDKLAYDESGYWLVKKTTDLRGNPRIREELLVTIAAAAPVGIPERIGPGDVGSLYQGIVAKRNFVAEGDSITDAGGWAEGLNTGAAYLAYPGFHTMGKKAVSGATLLEAAASVAGNSMESRAAATDALLVPGALNVLSILIGANDLNNTTVYPTTTSYLTALAEYCDARRAAGWKIALGTILPIDGNTGFNTRRAVVNTELRLWTTNGVVKPGKHVDTIIDFAADPIMGPDNSRTTNPTYWNDTIHPNTTGYARMRDIALKGIGGASALDTNGVAPLSVTRLLHLSPIREAGTAYVTQLAVQPNCSWEILAGSDAGFSLTFPETLNHPATTQGSYSANLRGTDAFGNVYLATINLLVKAANGQLNLAPNGGLFDTYIDSNVESTTTIYGIEEFAGDPALMVGTLTTQGYPQKSLGSSGTLVNGALYEFSFRGWKNGVGSTPIGVQINGTNYLTTGAPTSPQIVQGTFTAASTSAFSFLAVLFSASAQSGEKGWIDDLEFRRVIGPTISAVFFGPSGPAAARIGATTTGTTGTLYGVVTQSTKRPTKAQIKAGQDHTGAATISGSVAVTAAQAYGFNVSGLQPTATYYVHLVHEDANGFSNTLSSNGVATAVAGTTVFSDTAKGSAITLTNGGLTAQKDSSVANWQSVAGTNSISSGTHSFKITLGGTLGQAAIGISNSNNVGNLGTGWYPGVNASFNFGYRIDTNLLNGSASGLSAASTGDQLEFEFNADDKTIRVRNITKAPGTWSNAVDVSALAAVAGNQKFYPMVGLNNTTETLTADFTGWAA